MESIATTTTDISEDPPTVSAIPTSRTKYNATSTVDPNTMKRAAGSTDVWDEMSALRKALKANSRGYIAKVVVLTIGFCFFVSVLAGTVLAMPVIVLVSVWDQLRKFFTERKATKEAAQVVPEERKEEQLPGPVSHLAIRSEDETE